jgi:hypothetical protein
MTHPADFSRVGSTSTKKLKFLKTKVIEKMESGIIYTPGREHP